MSGQKDFFEALEVFLTASNGVDGLLTEVTKGKVLTVLGNDPEAPEAADDFQKSQVLRAKGLGLIVFGSVGNNLSADSPDRSIDGVMSFQVLLILSPLWGGRAFGDRKWRQLAVLDDLLKTLNGAEIGPVPNHCTNSVRVDDWVPEEIEGLNAWTVSCRRKLKIK